MNCSTCTLLNVGVVEYLPFQAVLERELPVFDLLKLEQSRKCNAVIRIQAKQFTEILIALHFDNKELETTPGKSRKMRRQRRQEKFHKTVVTPSTNNSEPESSLVFKLPQNIDLYLVSLQKEPGAGLDLQ